MLDKSARLRDGRGRFPRAQKPSFESLIAGFGDSWAAWRTLAIAIQGREAHNVERSSQDNENLTALNSRSSPIERGATPLGNESGERQYWALGKNFNYELYKSCTGRESLPKGPVKEVWANVGRGGGKTRAASCALVAHAIRDVPSLAPGERAKAFMLAQNKGTARQAFNYVTGILTGSKQLKRMIISQTKSQIQLSNSVDIEIVTSNYRHVRGYSCVAAIADEAAYWWLDSESSNSDKEVLAALRPGLARVPGSVLFVISSPHVARGALFEAHQKYWGSDSDSVLYWRGSTSLMNPSFSQKELDRAHEDDPVSAASEYESEFRKVSASYITSEYIDAVTETDRIMIPPDKLTDYRAFIDCAGGSGTDSTAMAIGHVDEDSDTGSPKLILDALIERRPPFSPSETLKEFSKILRMYRCSKIVGDRFGGAFPAEAFSKEGIRFSVTKHSKSQIYKEALPLLMSGRAELLDKPRLRSQLLNLERRLDRIDHPRGFQDDLANCALGCIVLLSEKGIKAHGTKTRSGHFIRLLWPSGDKIFCIGKTPDGHCIPGHRRRPKSSNNNTYKLSDQLWKEINDPQL